MPETLAIDANLLTVLIIGRVAPSYLGRNRRVRDYTLADYELLEQYIDGSRIIATPNAFTEVSNLTRKGFTGVVQDDIETVLREMMRSLDEIYLASSKIADVQEFGWLGLTDATWLEIEDNFELLTSDVGLYVAAIKRDKKATNFNHLRDEAGLL